MMRFLFCIFSTLIIALSASAQERSFIPHKYQQFTTDIQELIYAWNNDRLDQYSSDGKLLQHYSNPSMGYISKVDASIPTKIMVYYEESNSIVLLNNKLAPIGNPINLFDLGIQNPVSVCMFGINRLACYNEQNQQLILIDLDLNQTNVINCQFNMEFHPQHIVANHNFEQLALSDSTAGLAFYDRFGSFQKWIPYQGIQYLQLQNNTLYFLQDKNIYTNNLESLWSPSLTVEYKDIISFSKVLGNWYFLYSDGFIDKISISR